jgi:UDP-galactopyranose mutase
LVPTNKLDYKNLRVYHSKSVDLVCFSHLSWDFVYQRPQHLLTRAVSERRVFYIEEPRYGSDPARLVYKQDDSGVQIITPYVPNTQDKETANRTHIDLISQVFKDNNINHFILWYYTPMAIEYSSHLEPLLVIYDCMDELSAFKFAPKKMKEAEAQLLKRANLVFTGGQSLYEAKRGLHSEVHLFPSSIDKDHFNQARSIQADPVDQMDIPHPRLGYYGVIDERMDLELVKTLAQAEPEWHFVMIGPIAKIDREQLPRATNIHYMGNKPYRELPAYLAGWDVALLPFAQNEATKFISPTKTPEYLAGGKPVVSTPVKDVVRTYGEQGLVHIATNTEEFQKAIKKTLKKNVSERGKWIRKVDACLADLSWDNTWQKMRELILKELNNKPIDKKVQTGSNKVTSSSNKDIAPKIPPKERNGQKMNGRKNGSSGYDYLVVGAGFAGSVLAERLARGLGKRVLLIDKRSHIGGNAYDHYNNDGILIHKYGPHIFHTNSREVFTYLSQFTDWRQYEHRVLASVDGLLVPIPINLDTINRMYGLSLNAQELEKFYTSISEPREKILTSEDVVVSKVGQELYEKFFRNYTRKQWDLDPSQLDASVTSRVPIRMNRDDRYFTDTYQSMPLFGFTRMFETMLDHPRIHIMLNTDYHEIIDMIPYRELIYTGPIDEFFDYRYGKLPYRSLDFKFETLNKAVQQPVAVINYPNEHLYTRSTEFKYLTGQEHLKTTLVYEYPKAEGDPYYPIPRPENAMLYKKYQKLAEAMPNVHFVGRLATYKYYNMDQVTAQALMVFSKISGIERTTAISTQTPYYIPAPAASAQIINSKPISTSIK